MKFTVLFVCTGNVCRSPMAERFLRARVDVSAPISVGSAGTAALDGQPLDASSAVVLREFGADPDGHLGRRLTPELIADADLILTAEMSHRSIVLRTDPLAFRRVFTLREFGRLGVGFGPLMNGRPTVDSLIGRVEKVAAQRGIARLAAPTDDEISDPFGAQLDVMRSCAGKIVDAVDALVAVLGLSGEQWPWVQHQERRCHTAASAPAAGRSPSGVSAAFRRWPRWFRSGPPG